MTKVDILENWQARTSGLAKEADATLEAIFADLVILAENRTTLDTQISQDVVRLLNQLCSVLSGMGQVWPGQVRRGVLSATLLTANSLLLWAGVMDSLKELQQLRSNLSVMQTFEPSAATMIASESAPVT